MVLFIAGNADCKNFVEAAILSNVFCIEVRSVYSIVSNILLISRYNSSIGQLLVFSQIGFIFNNDDKVFHDRNILRVSGVTGTTLRCAL